MQSRLLLLGNVYKQSLFIDISSYRDSNAVEFGYK